VAESYTPGELRALSGVELGGLLSDIDAQIPPLVDASKAAIKALAVAETTLVYAPDDREARAARILHKATLKAIEIDLRALRSRQSRIQTIVRTIA
jgi:hypothetical protein